MLVGLSIKRALVELRMFTVCFAWDHSEQRIWVKRELR